MPATVGTRRLHRGAFRSSVRHLIGRDCIASWQNEPFLSSADYFVALADSHHVVCHLDILSERKNRKLYFLSMTRDHFLIIHKP